MRVGIIAKLIEDRKFGFIQTDHFRDDVFFHQSSLQGLTFKRLYEGQEVEFEINEILRMDEQKLEATIVQAASRPLSKSIDEGPQHRMRATHHPRARQRKPTWRNVETPSDSDPVASDFVNESPKEATEEATPESAEKPVSDISPIADTAPVDAPKSDNQ